MIDHLPQELIQRYREQRLLPGERRHIRDHTSGCQISRERLTDYEKLIAELRTEKEEWRNFSEENLRHPDMAELSRHAQGGLNSNELEIMETHWAMCRACASKVIAIDRES